MSEKPALGQLAPNFTAPVAGEGYSTESTVTLSALRGRPVVLYFYPKDDTPGCTTQACALRDGWETIKDKASVFGVSTDSIASHVKFQNKHSLPFPLISDADRAIAEAYGVWVEKSMYGKKYMGMERSTFVIDADGKIASVLEKVAPAKHLDLLLKVLG